MLLDPREAQEELEPLTLIMGSEKEKKQEGNEASTLQNAPTPEKCLWEIANKKRAHMGGVGQRELQGAGG